MTEKDYKTALRMITYERIHLLRELDLSEEGVLKLYVCVPFVAILQHYVKCEEVIRPGIRWVSFRSGS